MKDKTKERLGTILTGFTVIIITAGIIGMAVISKTDPDYNSNPLFIFSLIGFMAGFIPIVITAVHVGIVTSR